MLRTIVWFIYFWGYLIFHLPVLNRGLRALKNGDFATADAIAYKHVPEWCNTLVRLAGVEVTTTGLENIPSDTPVVFVANHRSLYDIPLMLTQLGKPIPLIAKIESQKIPLIRKWMELLHCLFLDRHDARQGIKILADAEELVRKGYNVGIFPEGTRYKGEEGEMGEFLSGGFRVAAKTGVPIVPVVLFNTRACLEGDGHFTMKPNKVAVHILPPVSTEGLNRQELKALPAQVESLLREELAKGM